MVEPGLDAELQMNDSVRAPVFSQSVAGADGEGVATPLPVTFFGRHLASLRSSDLVYLIRRGDASPCPRWAGRSIASTGLTEIRLGHINKDDR